MNVDGRRLEGRVAVVTGAGGAIGAAVARSFGREGAIVACSYRSREKEAAEVVTDIEKGGGTAFAKHLELTDRDSIDGFVKEVVERHGRVDILANVAGRIEESDTVRFRELAPEAAQAMLDIDVMGTILMCQAVLPHMSTGVIVNFSGTYGNGADSDNPMSTAPVAYATAKGAIRGLTSALARDLAPEIRVNAVAPGPIAANWEDDWNVDHAKVDYALGNSPLKRMGTPEEVAETVVFLASDGGGYVCGQTIQVDGGWNVLAS